MRFELLLSDCYADGDVSSSSTSSSSYAGGLVGQLEGNSAALTNCYATGNISSASATSSSYAGGLVGSFGSSAALTDCYTVSRILDNDSANKHWGALVGASESIEIANAHWLSFAESGAEYAVGYNADMGVPSGAGAVKHTAIEEFYDLADVLNKGQETPVWEHKTEDSLPTLIEKINEEEK